MSLLLLGLSSFRLTSLAAAGKPRDAVKFYEIALMHRTADLALTNSNRLELGCLYHELKDFDEAASYLAALVPSTGRTEVEIAATHNSLNFDPHFIAPHEGQRPRWIIKCLQRL